MGKAKAPFLTYEEVSDRAEQTLLESKWDGGIPVDMESIVEIGFGVEVVPIRGLKDDYSVDGFLTLDFTRIVVDEFILERHPTRYRFTLAHELGHRVLHADAFHGLGMASPQEWIDFYLGLGDRDYGWFERQAYWFAGAILVPEAPLVAGYSDALAKLMPHGISESQLSRDIRIGIAGALAKRFWVSTAVMQCRLDETGIW